ncbi:hypothetical protein K2V56_00875 [Staphylococcus chromogenes]|uniref:hypothetical protein n=1 Tax=Staphylococcus chromogenes TaxID=46126 RepID=UPI000D02BFED|nr:hypothetical protein [Staphylococcus chromogenes]MCD8904013.1 hypothetical protein [Staphylococcus chromogenes]UXS68089.1 hypothetical protein MUA19_01255 [Staphylococcus chromogenes]
MNNTKNSRTRRIVDTINLISSLLLLLLFIINFYAYVTPEKWEAGFDFSGISFIFVIVLVVTIIICASISFLHKSKR